MLSRLEHWRGGIFVRMLGSAVIAQALLSAANLCVGLILIRRTTDHAYGSYVLVLNALLLITQVQTQFITPAMVMKMSGAPDIERARLIGSLYRMQARLVPVIGFITCVIAMALWFVHALDGVTTWLVFAAIAAAIATLHREFFRMVMLAYRLPAQVLKVDALYVVILVSGAFIATFSDYPALTTVLVLCLAATIGGLLLSRALHRHEPWRFDGPADILRQIAVVGAWTTTSSAIHWTFTQGYNWVIVGTLDVKAVAAVAATRLLMMPINMLSTGVGSLMLPTTSGWVRRYAPRTIFLRLLLLCVGIAAIATCYFGVMWELRDWIFQHILKKQFAHRDLLICMWFAIFVLMVFRDQLLFLPLMRGRYRLLAGLTLISAVVSLSVCYLSILHVGVVGALIGVMVGEVISVVGLMVLSVLEMRKAPQALAAA